MKIHYEDLSESQFEDLVVVICKQLFGIGVQGFTSGKDGGRDGKFVGIAELFPSKSSPWKGITVIQAKHTNGYNASFSDTDFFSEESESSTLSQEVARIEQLRKDNEIDNYILFSNRKLSGVAEPKIRKFINKSTGLAYEQIHLACIKSIDSFLSSFPQIIPQLNLNPFETPLIVDPNELSEVVEAMAEHKAVIGRTFRELPDRRLAFEAKNALNVMTPSYAKMIRSRYLKFTLDIKHFLEHPANERCLKLYESTTEEFQSKIISKRSDYTEFDKVIEYLVDMLFKRDSILSKHRTLTRAMVFYMYYYCDIGESIDAET